MNLIKWDPFREFEGVHGRLNRMFGEPLMMRPYEEEVPLFTEWSPAFDIEETEKEYLVKADLPDVKKENVKITLENGILAVEGERKHEVEEKGKKFHRVERSYGKFVRRFALPSEIDAGNVKAEFKDGVLDVRVPKTSVPKPKAIEVKVA
jgi:HSP20 family protein